MRFFRRRAFFLAWVLLLVAACVPAAASTPPADEITVTVAPALSSTPAFPESTATAQPASPTSPAPTPSSTPTAAPTEPAPTPSAWPAACSAEVCYYPDVLQLARPIAPSERDTVDGSYRFGSTQDGKRDPHHGVEFLNPAGTPVLAAAAGIVAVAGDDRQTFYGPYSYFYGNLVILEHPQIRPGLFTLYGHLSEIGVTAGQRVTAGQEIGKVGMSGVATGSHLHFEVRLDGIEYADSRNPELWLAPHLSENGLQNGALAGRVIDASGAPLPVDRFVLERLASPDGPVLQSYYPGAYEEKALIGQPPYQERFGIGDLPAGWYRLSFVQYGMQQHLVEIKPGQLTMVTYRLEPAS